MKPIAVTATYFAIPILAESLLARQGGFIPSTTGSGFGSSGSIPSSSASENDVEELFEIAGRQPNETRLTSFEFFPGNVSSRESNITWTWRVNITDVPLPENISPGGLRVVNEQWQLQWPGDGSLEAYMNRSGIVGTSAQSLCLSAASYVLPSNVTGDISDADQGNCSIVLGDECAREFALSAFSNPECETDSFSIPAACMDTLGIASSFGSYSRMAVTGTSLSSLYSNDTFFHYTSSGVPASNISDSFVQAETRLNILQLQDIPALGRGTYGVPIVCQVVNPEASSAISLRMTDSTVWGMVLTLGLGFSLM